MPHYIVGEVVFYKYSAKLALNTRTGDLFTGVGMSPVSIPSGGIGGSLQIGWIANLEKNELGNNLGKTINSTLMGNSIGASLCYTIYCAGHSQTIGSSSIKQLYNVGFGKGGANTTFGVDNMWRLTNDK